MAPNDIVFALLFAINDARLVSEVNPERSGLPRNNTRLKRQHCFHFRRAGRFEFQILLLKVRRIIGTSWHQASSSGEGGSVKVNRCKRVCRPAGFAVSAILLALALAFATPVQAQFDTLFGSKTDLPPSAAVDQLKTPTEYRSENGRLDVTLEAKVQRIQVGKFSIVVAAYNGVYGGPVLHVKPGDVLHVHLINHLAQGTNIHFHGLSVSPQGHSDNSMYVIPPGQEWDYVVPIPADHNPGLYWYHTHAHGMAQQQLMAGLSGMLVIDGSADRQPELLPLKERLMALKEFQFDRKGRLYRVLKAWHNDIESINGQLMPRVDMLAGETQVWRLSNQAANTFFRLTLQGHTFTVIGRDSLPLEHPEKVNELIFGPAERLDVLVEAGAPGSYTFRSERTLTGPIGDIFPGQNMAQVIVSAPPVGIIPPALAQMGGFAYREDPALGTGKLAGVRTYHAKNLSDVKIDASRYVVFSSDDATGLFFINHRIFDHERIDFRVPLGNVEEWTLTNSADELHIFHIHQVPFQVMSVNGKPQPFNGLVDTVTVPIHGVVKIRLAFTDPRIVGQFMFHCHILEHEDKGMMAMIEVYDPKNPMPSGPHMMSGQPMVSSQNLPVLQNVQGNPVVSAAKGIKIATAPISTGRGGEK